MRKRNLIMVICAIITMALAIPLGAQSIPSSLTPVSNQKKATAQVFSTDVDNYFSVKSYDKVKFDKWFSYFGGDTSGNVNLGYATNLGGIYLGGFYSGRIIDTGTNETQTRTTYWDKYLQQQTSQQDDTTYAYGETKTNNNIAAFIGVAGMGIKVGFYENVSTANTPYNVSRDGTQTVTQNQDGSITYSGNDSISYEQSNGVLRPYLQWGMKLNIGDYVLTPRVSGQFNINRNILIDEYYSQQPRTEKDGTIVGAKEITRKEYNEGSLGLDIGVGADFYLKDTTYFGIDYVIGLNFYGQDYSGAGRSGSVDGTVNTTVVSRTEDYFEGTAQFDSLWLGSTEKDRIVHTITPSFWNTKTVMDNLKVGFLVKVPIGIYSFTESEYEDYYKTEEETYNDANLSSQNKKTTYEHHTPGNKKETSQFIVSPTVSVGASYALVPDRFTVNAGVTLRPIAYYSTSTVTSKNGIETEYTKTEFGAGSNQYTSEETKEVAEPTPIVDTVSSTSEWTGLSGNISVGFVFKFNDIFSLDLLATTANNGYSFNASLTDVNVLFSVKF